MTELVKFHKDVESVLENLTDDSQVSLETPFISNFELMRYCIYYIDW